MRVAVVLFCIGFICFSCNESEEEASLTITYKLTFGDDPLPSFSNVSYPAGYEVFFTKFSLFMSEIGLIGTAEDQSISDVDFIDLLTGIVDSDQALEGVSRRYSNIKVGEYSGLRFNVGLPAQTNLLKPSDFESDHPLSNTAEYWVGWSSYIFYKLEGKFDGDSDGEPETNIALHIGSNDAFRQIEITSPFEIREGDNQIEIVFDLQSILNLDQGYYEFEDLPQVHNLTQLPQALPILDNLSSGIVINQ